MIEVSRLNGTKYILNADLIQFIEETPDTVISLQDGKKLMVKERARELIKVILEYKKYIHSHIEFSERRSSQ